ncbi:MAG: WYL domain-containing protein [Deltaproteobacteria bacterium]|nr:WYL domain-containing protein [Deltaproteobacteria bacterium]
MVRRSRGVNLRQHAERRGWNLRTVHRDLDALRALGVPVETPEYGWHRVPNNWIPLAAVDVSREEMAALASVRHLAPGLRNTRIERAIDGLRSKLAGTIQQLLDFETPWNERIAAIDYGPHRETVEQVCDAVRRRVTLQIRYRKPEGEITERVIEPGVIHWEPSTETLYVRGWCRLREEQRTFAVHRIESSVTTDEPFAPRREAARDLAHAFRVWARTGTEMERVILRFSPAVAGEVRERHWHVSQRKTDLPDGGVVLEMQIAAPEELERLILGYGPDVVVEAPSTLAARIRERHAQAIEPRRMGTLAAVRAVANQRASEGR